MESIIKQPTFLRFDGVSVTDPECEARFDCVQLESGFMIMFIRAFALDNQNTTYNFPIPFVSAPFCICYQQGAYRMFCSGTSTTTTSFWVKSQDIGDYQYGGWVTTVIVRGRWK